MAKDIGILLHKKVQRFRKWAETNYPEITEDNDNGEWCFCARYDEMYSCAVDVIKCEPASAADEQMIDDLLYAIARDNEGENIIGILEDYNDWFSLLCRACFSTPYTNAKWQFAKGLKNYSGDDDLKSLIFEFLSIDNEYTERMALQSLASIDPQQAEKYAVEFWNRGKYAEGSYEIEYQRIMVLHVLYQIRSDKLQEYLGLAERSDYQYLKGNAEDIREMLKTTE